MAAEVGRKGLAGVAAEPEASGAVKPEMAVEPEALVAEPEVAGAVRVAVVVMPELGRPVNRAAKPDGKTI